MVWKFLFPRRHILYGSVSEPFTHVSAGCQSRLTVNLCLQGWQESNPLLRFWRPIGYLSLTPIMLYCFQKLLRPTLDFSWWAFGLLFSISPTVWGRVEISPKASPYRILGSG